MERRLRGLRVECELLAAEIAACESGQRQEWDVLPDRQRVDITGLYIAHMKELLAVKTKFIAILQVHHAEKGPS
jgi:hypothetical protein